MDKSNACRTILLCDDNLLNRKLICAFLSGLPFRIIEVDNGTECIRIALDSEKRIDLVLLDISLKDLSGIDVCRAIRGGLASRCPELPIIAYTAHAMQEDHNSYLENGFTAVLLKPLLRDDLLRVLASYGLMV